MAFCFLVSELTKVSLSCRAWGPGSLCTVCVLSISSYAIVSAQKAPRIPSPCLSNDLGRSVIHSASWGAFWDPPKWAVSPLLLYVPVGTTSALLQPEVHVGYFFAQTHSWESAVAPLPGPWLSMTLTERMMFCSSQSGGTRQ